MGDVDVGPPHEGLEAPRLCVLGEPELRWQDTRKPVGGKPGRALVALTAAPHGLTLEQLTEIVWPDRPPKSARPALHVHLGALRKRFADAPPGLAVERSGDRYLLVRNGWELDTELARALGRHATTLLEAGEPDPAIDLLVTALGLWRGPAYAVGGEVVADAAAHQIQLAALDLEERYVDALIHTDPARAEATALRLVDDQPYRERRWAQLMRVRAIQERTADALATYQDARLVLVEELGVEPGPELCQLERSVLTRDLSTTPVEAPTGNELGEIPTTLGPLVGRDEIVAHVEMLFARRTPVLLVGAPGAGKTRVAVEVARRVADQGQAAAWVDLRNAAFDHPDLGDDVLQWARDHAGGLVVVDNAEQAVDRVRDLVGDLRRSAPSTQVMVTSRVPVAESMAIVTVDALALPSTDDPDLVESADAVRLLRCLLDLLAPGVELDSSVAANLCRGTGGLPLGIRLAAELARTVPAPEIATATRARFGSDLGAALSVMFDHLGDDDREAFAAMSVVAGQLDADVAAALIGGTRPRDRVTRLVDHGLVQFTAGLDAPYSIPEPLREAGASVLTDERRREVSDRLTAECLARATARVFPATPDPDEPPLIVSLRRELPWCRQALDHLAAIGDDERALRLVDALEMALYGLGWWRENVEIQSRALAIPGPPSSIRAKVHALRGRPGLLHQFDEDHLSQAIAMADALGDAAVRARAEYHLATYRIWQGRHHDALVLLDRTRSVGEEVGDLFLIGEATRFSGVALVLAGEAERGMQLQLDLAHLLGRSPELRMLLPHVEMYLGHCRRHLGDDDAALADLQRARVGFEALDNTASLIHVCAGIADIHADHGRHDRALEAAGRGLAISSAGPIDVYDPWLLCTTARVHADAGDATLARGAAGAAVDALAHTFEGETHLVAAELASVAHTLGRPRAALRLAGLADATPDRRGFRSPASVERLGGARDAARQLLEDEAATIYERGASSSVAEAASQLTNPD